MSTAPLRRAAAPALAVAALIAVATAAPAAAFQDKDCADFKNHRQAQHYYKKHGGPKYDPQPPRRRPRRQGLRGPSLPRWRHWAPIGPQKSPTAERGLTSHQSVQRSTTVTVGAWRPRR